MFKSKKKNLLTTYVQGIVMGIVEVIPGVSGSTLALIMGIYDQFIDFLHQVSDLMKTFIKVITGKKDLNAFKKELLGLNYTFGGMLGLGMVTGIGVFSHLMSYLLEHFPAYTYAFFFGLILASIRVPFFQVKKMTTEVWATFVGAAVVFFFVLGMNPAAASESPSLIRTFISGFFAICAMVLPGVSGSFVLLLFGMYDYVIDLIKHLTKLDITSSELLTLTVLGLGVVMGFALFVRVIKIALKKYPSYLMSSLAGLMVASLRILWPFMDAENTSVKYAPWDIPFSEVLPILVIIFLTSAVVLSINEGISKKKFKL